MVREIGQTENEKSTKKVAIPGLVLAEGVSAGQLSAGFHRFEDIAAALKGDAPVLVVLPHPAVELAHLLARSEDFESGLAAWADMARQRQQVLRPARRRCSLIAPDALLDPVQDEQEMLRARLGLWPEALAVEEVTVDPVDLLSAMAALQASSELEQLAEEITAMTIGGQRFSLTLARINAAWQEWGGLRQLAQLQTEQIAQQQEEVDRQETTRNLTRAELQAEIARLLTVQGKQAAQIQAFGSERDLLQEQIKHQQAVSDHQSVQFSHELTALQAENSRLLASQAELMQPLQAECDLLREQITHQQDHTGRQNAAAEHALVETRADAARLGKDHAEQAKALARLGGERDQLHRDLEQSRAANVQLKREVSDLEVALRDLTAYRDLLVENVRLSLAEGSRNEQMELDRLRQVQGELALVKATVNALQIRLRQAQENQNWREALLGDRLLADMGRHLARDIREDLLSQQVLTDASAQQGVARLRAELAQSKEELERLKGSRSWRLTAPLRRK